MSQNNIPHIVDQGSSFMPHDRTKPLEYEEIEAIWKKLWYAGQLNRIAYDFAREIEKAHGIE